MRTCTVIATSLFLGAAAHAQSPLPAPPAQPGPQTTVRCAPVQPPQAGEKDASAQQTTGQSREPLSDRLAQSDGVICPPSGIDAQMNKGAPEVGRMPVIPPPGSPGGDPTVRPK